jgi:hypothetical protein
MARGFSRLQALQIIEEVGEWLINMRDDEKPFERPAAVYSNPTPDQLIDKILNNEL